MDSEKAVYNSPIGSMAVSIKNDKVFKIEFLDEIQEADKPITTPMRFLFNELDEYFSGNLRDFKSELAPVGSDFEMKVWEELKNIPYSQTRSYKEIAIKLGDKNSVRAVGGANGRNSIPLLIPCHRVIGENGSLTGFTGGLKRKSWLLEHEGAIAEQLRLF